AVPRTDRNQILRLAFSFDRRCGNDWRLTTLTTKRIFISGVSYEFQHARKRLSDHLQECNVLNDEQTYFGRSGYSLLTTLKMLIADCDAIICLVGRTSGEKPGLDAQAQFLKESGIKPPQGL